MTKKECLKNSSTFKENIDKVVIIVKIQEFMLY